MPHASVFFEDRRAGLVRRRRRVAHYNSAGHRIIIPRGGHNNGNSCRTNISDRCRRKAQLRAFPAIQSTLKRDKLLPQKARAAITQLSVCTPKRTRTRWLADDCGGTPAEPAIHSSAPLTPHRGGSRSACAVPPALLALCKSRCTPEYFRKLLGAILTEVSVPVISV